MPNSISARRKADIAQLQHVLKVFNIKMMKRLKENSWRVGWDNPLIRRELILKLMKNAFDVRDGNPEACIDVANYAMFLHKMLSKKMEKSGLAGISKTLSVNLKRSRHAT